MSNRIEIKADMLTWAIARAGYELHAFIEKFPKVEQWLEGKSKPTFKQLEAFAKKAYVPFGYLFLKKPPKEELPIPYFRSNPDEAKELSINVYDTILQLKQRQDWLTEYLQENGFEKLDFVGKFKDNLDVDAIVEDIKKTLNLHAHWASAFKTWKEAKKHLVEQIEELGIITTFNGVVGNNPHRVISIDDCRGFVLVDDYAPFIFINNTDWKSAQMFTIVHELAHIWTGHSAGFDFRKLQPADNEIEIICDRVAAEFLVPTAALTAFMKTNKSIDGAAKHFKVSRIVIARRVLDIGIWSKKEFFKFYQNYASQQTAKKDSTKSSGGNFYATAKKRLSVTFAAHIHNAVKSGQLLYREAYRLTDLKGGTFEKFYTNHF